MSRVTIKKYEFTEETKVFCGRKLHRIRALRDFGDVKAGDLGGFIEKEENLSHGRNCWVRDDATVYDNARIFDNAEICDNAEIFGDAVIFGNARIYDNAEIYGNARIYDNARIYGNAEICGNAVIYGNAEIFGDAVIYGRARICEGKWDKSPLYIQGTKWEFYVSSENTITTGCQIHTFEEWQKNYKQIAKEHDGLEVLTEYIRYFNLACEMYGKEEYKIDLKEEAA